MSLHIVHKIYPGNIPRPTPLILESENGNLQILASPWGGTDLVEASMKSWAEYYSLSRADKEATSPYSRLPGLTSAANSLRIGGLIANDQLYKAANRQEFTQACEVLVIAHADQELTWIQVGQPHFFLFRDGTWIPLSVAVDLSVDFNSPIPLPSKLLGLDGETEIETRSIGIKKGDLFLALARSQIPNSLLTLPVLNPTAEDLVQRVFEMVVRFDSEQPFWTAAIQIR